MRACTETWPRRLLVAALLAAAAILSVQGCGAGVSAGPQNTRSSSSARQPARPGRAARPLLRAGHDQNPAGLRERHGGPPPTGIWAATGTVLSAVHLASAYGSVHAGEVRKRPWAFKTICKLSWCRTLFLRGTLYGPSVTTLAAHHGYYTAAFPPVAVRCSYSGELLGQLHDSYTLWWSANRHQILALERSRGSGRCDGPPSRSTFRWTATRLHR